MQLLARVPRFCFPPACLGRRDLDCARKQDRRNLSTLLTGGAHVEPPRHSGPHSVGEACTARAHRGMLDRLRLREHVTEV